MGKVCARQEKGLIEGTKLPKKAHANRKGARGPLKVNLGYDWVGTSEEYHSKWGGC